MTWCEQALLFPCAGETLVGVLARPGADQGAADTAVLIIVGGPQYRGGSHRQFVQLTRALALAGYPALRFDVRGMGDSDGAIRNFEQFDDDIASAIDAVLTAEPRTRRIVLCGLCDGASAALLYWHRTHDVRVEGLCLLNPWVRSSTSLAHTHLKHYYLSRLSQPEFWRKAFSGQVGRMAAVELLATLRRAIGRRQRSEPTMTAAPFQHRMAQAWTLFPGPILLVLSARDHIAKEFLEQLRLETFWSGALDKASLTRIGIANADHTFSDSTTQSAVHEAVTNWLQARNF